jgi:hypothetical protein
MAAGWLELAAWEAEGTFMAAGWLELAAWEAENCGRCVAHHGVAAVGVGRCRLVLRLLHSVPLSYDISNPVSLRLLFKKCWLRLFNIISIL